MRARPKDQVSEAAALVQASRGQLRDAEAQLVEGKNRVSELEKRIGVRVADEPASVDRLAAELTQARTRIELVEAAVATLRERAGAAESAYLAAEAEAFEVAEVLPRRRALEVHNEKTKKLLADLEAHEGAFVPEVGVLRQKYARDNPGQHAQFVLPRSEVMQRELALFEAKLQALLDLAAGRDVSGLRVEEYPECVSRPDSLVKAPAYARKVATFAADVDRLENEVIPTLQERIATLRASLDAAAQTREAPQAQNLYPVADRQRDLTAAEAALARSVKDLDAKKSELQALSEAS